MSDQTVFPFDVDYPAGLHRIPNGGPVLHVRGRLPAARGVAIVGTRWPSPQGARLAFDMAYELAKEGVAIWSGGAFGIDTAAHRGAITAEGSTVVVMGSGLDHQSPRHNLELFGEVLGAGGAWISQFEPQMAPRTYRFLARNAVLAAAVELLVIVECPLKSGARNAAKHARESATPIAAVPHSPWEEAGAGCNVELSWGAHVVTCAADVLALLERLARGELATAAPPPPRPRKRAPAAAPSQLELASLHLELAPTEPLSVFASRILAGLDHARYPDEIAIELAAPAAEVLAALTELRLGGHVASRPDGRVQRSVLSPARDPVV